MKQRLDVWSSEQNHEAAALKLEAANWSMKQHWSKSEAGASIRPLVSRQNAVVCFETRICRMFRSWSFAVLNSRHVLCSQFNWKIADVYPFQWTRTLLRILSNNIYNFMSVRASKSLAGIDNLPSTCSRCQHDRRTMIRLSAAKCLHSNEFFKETTIFKIILANFFLVIGSEILESK